MAKKIRKKTKAGTRFKNKFLNASHGIWIALKEETTFIFYFFAILLCIGLGIWLDISLLKWAIVALTIGILLGFELINTAIENFVDLLAFEYSERAKKIKDICAAASIINAIMSVIIGFLIYLEPLIEVFKQMN